jgi:hypothetical protein
MQFFRLDTLFLNGRNKVYFCQIEACAKYKVMDIINEPFFFCVVAFGHQDTEAHIIHGYKSFCKASTEKLLA